MNDEVHIGKRGTGMMNRVMIANSNQAQSTEKENAEVNVVDAAVDQEHKIKSFQQQIGSHHSKASARYSTRSFVHDDAPNNIHNNPKRKTNRSTMLRGLS